MNATEWMNVLLSGTISVVALIVSLYTLWATHLKPFTPIFIVEGPTMRFYRYEHGLTTDYGGEEKSVEFDAYDPLIDIKITVYNGGACPGKIQDFRLVFESESLDFAIYPSWIINTEAWNEVFQDHANKPTRPWMVASQAEEGGWHGMIVSGNTEESVHIAMESNESGFKEIPLEHYNIRLEYWSNSNPKWIQIDSYSLLIDEWMEGELKDGKSFNFANYPENRKRDPKWKNTEKILVITDELSEELEGESDVEKNA